MTDWEKEYRSHGVSPTRLDSETSSSEPSQDPLELPSVVPPLEGVTEDIGPTDNPPPDGGLQAWLQVLGSFFLFFNSW